MIGQRSIYGSKGRDIHGIYRLGQSWRTVRVPRFSTRHRRTARSPRLTLTLRGVGWNTGTNWTSLSMTSSATDHCPVSTWPLLTNTSVAKHVYKVTFGHTNTETHGDVDTQTNIQARIRRSTETMHRQIIGQTRTHTCHVTRWRHDGDIDWSRCIIDRVHYLSSASCSDTRDQLSSAYQRRRL